MLRTLRLSTGLVLFSFVTCHLANHSFGLWSREAPESASRLLMALWSSSLGEVLLMASLLTHLLLALYSIWNRRSLHMRPWEWLQLGLGLSIPFLLMLHLSSTVLAEAILGISPGYDLMLALYWEIAPHLGVIQFLALLTVWIHGCMGLHYWLRTKAGYEDWQPWLGLAAVMLPSLAIGGWVAGGQRIREALTQPGELDAVMQAARITPEGIESIHSMAYTGLGIYGVMLAIPFIARLLRRQLGRLRKRPLLLLTRHQSMSPSATTSAPVARRRAEGRATPCRGAATTSTGALVVAEPYEYP